MKEELKLDASRMAALKMSMDETEAAILAADQEYKKASDEKVKADQEAQRKIEAKKKEREEIKRRTGKDPYEGEHDTLPGKGLFGMVSEWAAPAAVELKLSNNAEHRMNAAQRKLDAGRNKLQQLHNDMNAIRNTWVARRMKLLHAAIVSAQVGLYKDACTVAELLETVDVHRADLQIAAQPGAGGDQKEPPLSSALAIGAEILGVGAAAIATSI